MATRKGVENMRLYYLKRKGTFDGPVGSQLPEAYRKFWNEWRHQPYTAVHYIEKPGKYMRNEETGEVFPIQNIPIPIILPKEHNEGIWGGEGIIRGFQKRHPLKRRVPHFWFPTLKKSVVYSEVLDKYMNIVVTQRTIDLIHENYGFDHYLLKTPASDLKSELALKLKRQILQSLSDKSLYPDDATKKEEVYAKYEKYLTAYTREEIEWYGLTWIEACRKIKNINADLNVIRPLKHLYRADLIAQLKATKEIEAANQSEETKTSSSWFPKINSLWKGTKTQ